VRQWVNETQIHEVPCAVVLVVGEGDKVTAAKYAEDMEEIFRRNANRCGETALQLPCNCQKSPESYWRSRREKSAAKER
jgi:hypothetical protein